MDEMVTLSVESVLEAFDEKVLFEAYRMPLLMMLMAQHKAHYSQWKLESRHESKKVMDKLEQLATKQEAVDWCERTHGA